MELKLTFDVPKHGWLPCEIWYGENLIEFEASDVPNNPVADLVESLWKAIRGETSEVWWHLEPAGYYFLFEPNGKELIFKLLFSPDSKIPSKRTIFGTSVNLKTVLMMFWRSVKKIDSFAGSDTDWSNIDEDDLEKLKLQIINLDDN